MIIEPVSKAGDYACGSLHGLRFEEIVATLGFMPNVADDPSKVRHSWGFTVDGQRCGIWDYKGSANADQWSFFGPKDVFVRLFSEAMM